MSYHYVITVQSSVNGVLRVSSDWGTTEPYRDRHTETETRLEIFQRAFEGVCRVNDFEPARTSVLFFCLEPNEFS